LLILFFLAVLVDANRIYPKNSLFVLEAEVSASSQCGCKICPNLEINVREFCVLKYNSFGFYLSTPNIR
jgi:hypothetical protein